MANRRVPLNLLKLDEVNQYNFLQIKSAIEQLYNSRIRAGSNVTITQNPDGSTTISATGGGDQMADLTKIIAGTNIRIDRSIPGQITINSVPLVGESIMGDNYVNAGTAHIDGSQTGVVAGAENINEDGSYHAIRFNNTMDTFHIPENASYSPIDGSFVLPEGDWILCAACNFDVTIGASVNERAVATLGIMYGDNVRHAQSSYMRNLTSDNTDTTFNNKAGYLSVTGAVTSDGVTPIKITSSVVRQHSSSTEIQVTIHGAHLQAYKQGIVVNLREASVDSEINLTSSSFSPLRETKPYFGNSLIAKARVFPPTAFRNGPFKSDIRVLEKESNWPDLFFYAGASETPSATFTDYVNMGTQSGSWFRWSPPDFSSFNLAGTAFPFVAVNEDYKVSWFSAADIGNTALWGNSTAVDTGVRITDPDTGITYKVYGYRGWTDTPKSSLSVPNYLSTTRVDRIWVRSSITGGDFSVAGPDQIPIGKVPDNEYLVEYIASTGEIDIYITESLYSNVGRYSVDFVY